MKHKMLKVKSFPNTHNKNTNKKNKTGKEMFRKVNNLPFNLQPQFI